MKKVGIIALGLALVVSVSAGVSNLTVKRAQSKSASSLDASYQNVRLVNINTPSGIETDFTIAAENSVNAVVHIASKSLKKTTNQVDIFEYFFGNRGQEIPQQQQPQVGYGSGVIISPDGYIVTNNHVVEGADEISVTLNERKTYSAKVVGADPNTDIALIKIDAQNLPVISFGNSDNLKVGEWVLAVGNPMNLASTVTAGIVSAKARNLGIIANEGNDNPFQNQKPSSKSNLSIESFIQTDAAVNPGNSGGALVNLRGELVGINTAIISPTGSFTGYSFAIPVNLVAKVVADIKQFGTVQRAMLGVTIRDINSEMAKEKNISVQDGVYVEDVADHSGAMEAGIKKGDIITKINDLKVNTASELQEQVGLHRPGDMVELTVKHGGGKDLVYKVKLRNLEGGTTAVKSAGVESLGAAFSELSSSEKKNLNISYGVQVSGVTDGKFKQAGIRKGYIILKINDVHIQSVSQVEDAIRDVQRNANVDDRGLFIVGMYPNGKITYYAIDLAE